MSKLVCGNNYYMGTIYFNANFLHEFVVQESSQKVAKNNLACKFRVQRTILSLKHKKFDDFIKCKIFLHLIILAP